MQLLWNVKIYLVRVIVRTTGMRRNHAENVCKMYLKSKTPIATGNGDSGHCAVVLRELLTLQ